MEWLTDNQWLLWLILAFVLAVVETSTVDFVFGMLAVGALAGAAAAFLGLGVTAQVVIAVAVAVLMLAVVRPMAKRRFLVSEASYGIGAASLVGRDAQVLQTVTRVDGRVKLAGETWSARTTDPDAVCRPGDDVHVVAIEGATVIVTRKADT